MFLHQAPVHCTPNASTCYETVASDSSGCMFTCTGLFAHVGYKTDDDMRYGKDWLNYSHLLEQYDRYKRNYARNIKFDTNNEDLSKYQNKGL